MAPSLVYHGLIRALLSLALISGINFKTFLIKLALFQTQSSVQILSPVIFVLLPKQWKQLIPCETNGCMIANRISQFGKYTSHHKYINIFCHFLSNWLFSKALTVFTFCLELRYFFVDIPDFHKTDYFTCWLFIY